MMSINWTPERHRAFALVFLCALTLILTEPIVFRGQVATPVDLQTDFASLDEPQSANQLPYLHDVVQVFIPKLDLHFHGDHAGWNTTWNPHTQLGKPSSHFGGYSKAYPLTYCLSFLTTDPYRLHALLSVVTVFLMTLFAYFLLLELGLHPAAALVGAVGIGLNTRTAYWFGFAQFLAWVAWSMAIMWLSLRLIKQWRPLPFLGLVFSCYCLAIGARHQAVIRMAYLVVPFVLLMIMNHRMTWRSRARSLAGVGMALVLGLVLSLPLVLGFGMQMTGSARMAKDLTDLIHANSNPFFTEDLGMLWNVFAYGNPSTPDFPMKTPAINFTPFCFPLVFVAFLTPARKRAWIFGAVFAAFMVMSISPAVHLFAIKYLGFGFSAARPLGGAFVPALIFCAFGIDALLDDRDERNIGRLRPLLTVAGATLIGAIAVMAPGRSDTVDWTSFSLGLGLAGAAAVFVCWRSPLILYASCLISVAAFSAPALMHRPAEELASTSDAILTIQTITSDGHRFAKFGGAARFLPSNEEVLANLRSIHTYDSLSSVAYERLIGRLSNRGMRGPARNFSALDNVEKVLDDAFSYTGVNCIVSRRGVSFEGWDAEPLGPRLVLHTAETNPSLIAHLMRPVPDDDSKVELHGSLAEQPTAGDVTVESHRDDELAVRVRPSPKATLLFVSTQFHKDWVATAGGERLRTIPINNFYLGVELPSGVSAVLLRFLPLSRWAWMPLVFFALMFPLAGAITLWRGRD